MNTVLRVITRLNIGGPARQALLLARELAGDFPTILAAGTPPESEGELSDPGVRVHPVPLVRPVRPWTDVRAYRDLRGLMDVHRPAIVHTHMAKAGAVGRLVATRTKPTPRIVHTFHGHVLEGYFSNVVQRTFVALERRLAARSDVLIAVSNEIRDSLLELKVGVASQFRVIPLGFELEPLLRVNGATGAVREHLRLGADVPLVGVLGRLAAIKDHASLIEAMSRLPDIHLAVFGDGELRQRLQEQVADLGIADRIHFMGWWADPAPALADLDLVVLTSRNEGTPVSLIEALAAGKAVVATDVGGVRSVVDDGLTGMLVPAGDAGAIARAIEDILRDREMREAMGTAGRRLMQERFSSQRLCRDIAHLYRDLLH